MHPTALLTFILLVATPMAAVAQAATVYHWVDAQGHVHYSQSPPPGVTATAVKIVSPPAPVSSSPAERQNLEKFLHAQQAKQKQQAAAQAAQARKLAQQQQRCTAARKRLQEFLASHTVLSPAAANATGDFGNERLTARQTACRSRCRPPASPAEARSKFARGHVRKPLSTWQRLPYSCAVFSQLP